MVGVVDLGREGACMLVLTRTEYVSQHELLTGEAWLASREKYRARMEALVSSSMSEIILLCKLNRIVMRLGMVIS